MVALRDASRRCKVRIVFGKFWLPTAADCRVLIKKAAPPTGRGNKKRESPRLALRRATPSLPIWHVPAVFRKVSNFKQELLLPYAVISFEQKLDFAATDIIDRSN